MSKEIFEDLCQLMANVKLKATEYSINIGSAVDAVFSDCFVVEIMLAETEKNYGWNVYWSQEYSVSG